MAFRRPVTELEVLSIDDLDGWPSDGRTWLAVLGHPIKHSISPAMHGAALKEMARAHREYSRWGYVRFDVPPERLPEALEKLHAHGFTGLNLTVPHKVLAFGRIAQIDPSARPVGAVNTLRRTASGWEGFNTDGYGMAAGMREDLGAEIAGAHVILLGAGGAARGAAVECLQRGCASLWICNRTAANLETLLHQLKSVTGKTQLRGFAPAEIPAELPTGAWVINSTSAGLHPGDPMPIDLARLPKPAGVYDMIYNPAVTPLLGRARELGLPAANGLSMLVHQGVRALEIWTGRSVPVDAMRQAARQAMRI
ncbi:shikimate dehydrogenase [Opitutaceae bacterium EW11]|nr:shikimate dehydrogenase [Opitutaceae bacterium EW11]